MPIKIVPKQAGPKNYSRKNKTKTKAMYANAGKKKVAPMSPLKKKLMAKKKK